MKSVRTALLFAATMLASASVAFRANRTGLPEQDGDNHRSVHGRQQHRHSWAALLADKLGTLWKQTVIVENRPGIAGNDQRRRTARRRPHLDVTSNGHTIIGALNKGLTIDPIKDFAGVIQIASVPVVLIVSPDLPVKNLKELVGLAKKKPGTLNFTSAGLASSNYIAGELLKQTAKIDIVHMPYQGHPGDSSRA